MDGSACLYCGGLQLREVDGFGALRRVTSDGMPFRAGGRLAVCPDCGGVQKLVGPEMGALVITHFPRILEYIKPGFVHVFSNGNIVAEGGPELARQIEEHGYERFLAPA